jgi:hypothetical protein
VAKNSIDRHRVTSVGTRLDPTEDKQFRALVDRIPGMTISKAVATAIREWLDRNETTSPETTEEQK